MTDDEGGKEASFGLLDLNDPSLAPFVLKVEERVSDTVMVRDLPLCPSSLRRAEQVTGELLHGGGSSVEEMAGPRDRARDDWKVSNDGWVRSLLLIFLLNLLDQFRVLAEEYIVLVHQDRLEVLSVEDGTELAKQTQRVLDVDDVREVAVNVGSEVGLDAAHINVKLDEVTIKGIILVVKERMVDLAAESVDVLVEGVHNRLDVLEIVLLKGLELADCAEELNELADTTAEQVELAEDLGGVEVELLGLRHGLKTLLGEHVLLDIGFLELLAALKDSNKLIMGVLCLVPEAGVLEGSRNLDLGVGEGAHEALRLAACLEDSEVHDVVLAVRDHLVGDLDEEASHAFSSVIVAGNGVNHLD